MRPPRDVGDVATSGREDSGTLGGAVARALLAELVAALEADPMLRWDLAELLDAPVSSAGRDERLMTVTDVAAMLGVSERSVYRALRDGRLRGDRIGSTWRISAAAVDDWKAGRRVHPVLDRAPRRSTLLAAPWPRSIATKEVPPRRANGRGRGAGEATPTRSARYSRDYAACLVLDRRLTP